MRKLIIITTSLFALAVVGLSGFAWWTSHKAQVQVQVQVEKTQAAKELREPAQPRLARDSAPDDATEAGGAEAEAAAQAAKAQLEKQVEAEAAQAAEARHSRRELEGPSWDPGLSGFVRPNPVTSPEQAKPRGVTADQGGVRIGGNVTSSTITVPDETKKMAQNKQVLEQLPEGQFVIAAPREMKVGDVGAVHADIGRNVALELLRKHSGPGEQTIEGNLRISSEMTAVLVGAGFKISRTSPEQQSVAESYPTSWSWEIEAREQGEQKLEVILYALLPAASASRQQIASSNTKINVTVKPLTFGEFLKSGKDAVDAVNTIIIAISAAVTAVLGWLGWSSYGRRKMGDGTRDKVATLANLPRGRTRTRR